MFLLHGSPLQIDVAFKYDGISYPANWLRLATADEKAAVGITEAPDPAVYDDRFYWNFGVPKDLSDLKKSWSQQIDNQAYTILLPSDWIVVRKAEGGADVPAEWSTYRAAVRAKAADIKASLNSATDIQEFINSVTNIQWPRDPNAPAL